MIRTLLDLARDRAEAHPERGYRFLGDGVDVTDQLSYAELDRDARRIAVALKLRGIEPGARALLVYPPGLDFVRAFWGCVYAGVIAVPAPPPDPIRIERTLPRLRAIAGDCKPAVTLDPSTTFAGDGSTWRPPEKADIAFLQYTSGTTRAPRGVIISHANLLHNLDMLRTFHLDQAHMVMLHWLPLFHDMGLIRGMLSPLHMGGDCVMMPALRFVERPLRWLRALETYGATTTGAPNFGYEYCVRKVTAEEAASLDLSALRIAFCSSEPIRRTTLDQFTEKFALRADVMRPSYGLAEATVFVAGELEHYRSYTVDGRDVVSCGQPLGGQEVRILDGEVWIRGPSISGGYWNNAGKPGGYLATGDLGWIAPDGALCITGRKKDLIIVRGENYFPQDIEAVVEQVPGVRPGCSAAFGLDVMGSEAVAIVCEATEDLLGEIRRVVNENFGLSLHAIVIIAPGQIAKTASGKVQRSTMRQRWLDGELAPLHASTPP